jgi:acetyl-CoA synthetase
MHIFRDNSIVLFCNFREGNDPDDYSRLTYRKLLEEVCRFANVLKSRGVTKGDRVAIYMPMILEVIIAILACSRIGAVHTIVVCR